MQTIINVVKSKKKRMKRQSVVHAMISILIMQSYLKD